jgi:intracellular multiplication protein IcmT
MDLHWRNSQKIPRFFAFDARAFAVVFFFLLHMKLWTFALLIVTIIIFWILERRGLTFEASLRALRVWIIGRRRPALLTQKKRAWVDFG